MEKLVSGSQLMAQSLANANGPQIPSLLGAGLLSQKPMYQFTKYLCLSNEQEGKRTDTPLGEELTLLTHISHPRGKARPKLAEAAA